MGLTETTQGSNMTASGIPTQEDVSSTSLNGNGIWQTKEGPMNLHVYTTIYVNLRMLTYVQTDFCKAAPKMFYGLSEGDEIPGETVSSSLLTSVFNFFPFTFKLQ